MENRNDDIDLDLQAETLAQKVRHYLITSMGETADRASNQEIYEAFCYALREDIMINWLASEKTFFNAKARTLYYLSMEYLPGRFLASNAANISSLELLHRAINKMEKKFSELIECEFDPGLGNGGLGRLASCFLDSLATHHYPARAYGLRYQYGIFEQQLWDGFQIEAPDCWLINESPWGFRRNLRRVNVKYCGRTIPTKNIHGDEIYELRDYEEVGTLPYDIPIVGYSENKEFSVLTLRLWTTHESPRNFRLQSYNLGRLDQASENTSLTDVLYPSDHHEMGKRTRLKQEFLLVSASIQDIIRHYLTRYENFRLFIDKVRIQINDTHPALVIPELIRLLTQNYDIPWKMAVEMAQTVTGYTNHTILSEALEVWDRGLLEDLLPRQLRIIEQLNHDICSLVRQKGGSENEVRTISIIEDGRVRMANLAVLFSHRTNGVAKLHTEILQKKLFHPFAKLLGEGRIVPITNGVTQRRWLYFCNGELTKLISKRIGKKWIEDFSELAKLLPFAEDQTTQQEFLEVKRKNKELLIHYIHSLKLRDQAGNRTIDPPIINMRNMFDVQIKRIHEYKRQILNALHILMLYQEVKANPKHHGRIPRSWIFAGKAAASYEMAKFTIRFIHMIARRVNNDPAVNQLFNVYFMENYNISSAELLIPAADLSEQISTAGMEASGTGNMKLAMNGALTIGTEDGANIEMKEKIGEPWWPFSFGLSSEEVFSLRNSGAYRPWDLCTQFPAIKRVLDLIRDGSLATNSEESQAVAAIYRSLMEGDWGRNADYYFVLKDLPSYYEAQKKVEALYQQPLEWAKYALYNIAGMGSFSSDRSIAEYAKKEIWGINPCPIDSFELAKIRDEHSKYDRCRIF